MNKSEALQFAEAWIAAWNSHDLDQIMAHYSADFEMSSPVIRQLAAEPSGRLRGQAAVRAYWQQALALAPDLKFELQQVLLGAQSITIIYQGVRGLAAEVLVMNEQGLICQAMAHY